MRNRQLVLTEIKAAVAQERRSQLLVLNLLREVDHDGHYLELGYPDLFTFVTKALGYSAGAAVRRIQCMRLLRTMPELEPAIETGTLSLCVAAKTLSFLRAEDQKRRQEGKAKLSPETKKEIAQSMVGRSVRECEKKLAEISPTSALPPERTRELGLGKTLIQFSASPALMEKLERLKNLLAHQNPNGSYEGLVEVLSDIALKKVEPKAPEVTMPITSVPEAPKTPKPDAHPASSSNVAESAKRSRYIPVEVKRAVFARDGGACTYTDPKTGRRCGSRFALQYEHIHPFAWHGRTTETNLRLLCRNHNLHTASIASQLGLNLHRKFPT